MHLFQNGKGAKALSNILKEEEEKNKHTDY